MMLHRSVYCFGGFMLLTQWSGFQREIVNSSSDAICIICECEAIDVGFYYENFQISIPSMEKNSITQMT